MPDQDAQPSAHAANTRIEALSRQFIEHFYRRDTAWCLPYCHADVSYVGSTHEGFSRGIEQLRHMMSHVLARYSSSVALRVETSSAVLDEAGTVLVIVQFITVSDPSSGHVRARRRRGTLVWSQTDDGPLLRHLHVSAPFFVSFDDSGEHEPLRDTYLYAKALLNQVIRRESVPLRAVDGTMYNVSPVEIRCVEASRQRCIVHTMERDIVVRRSFKALVGAFGDSLVPVHRSFAVNPQHVRSVDRDSILLDDGARIPVPQRRSKQVRATLAHALDGLAAEHVPYETAPAPLVTGAGKDVGQP